ncbi:tRNA (adenosine(37)-N6)-threonylcarbamoyltransferase complex dimerization subunit type 1 TsaB [Saccharopolyspora sp. NPDC050389]|uniref:tRNA (adenosine(37)-N6)-threonylcarbamoyltransferase complex dimerization subunit type 1 TsaB n=1 Tax=Saccharopolyspora sp. NPDC050389 TaxID=3155516 RepID=UPI00340A333B
MLVIALDTSTPAVTAGLVALDDGPPRALAERVTVNPRAHGELLMPQLLDVMTEAGRELADADAIVVGAGPGPFTGLRVGMATAAALGQACGRPVHPVCSLDAIAAQATTEGPLLVATDARRKEVYWAAYDAARTRIDGPHVRRPAEVSTDGFATAAGEMAEELGITAVEPRYPTPVGLVAAARAALQAEPAPLVPLYLRRPDAEAPGKRKSVLTRGGK